MKKILHFNSYKETMEGREAFERNHQWTAIVFEVETDRFQYWNPQPRDDDDFYGTGLPFDYTLTDVKEMGYSMPELAEQLGAINAWGLDL